MTQVSPIPHSAHISVCEVGPRDGFQNENTFIPTARKIEIVTPCSQAVCSMQVHILRQPSRGAATG